MKQVLGEAETVIVKEGYISADKFVQSKKTPPSHGPKRKLFKDDISLTPPVGKNAPKKTPPSLGPKRKLFKEEVLTTPAVGNNAPKKGSKNDAEEVKNDLQQDKRRSPRLLKNVVKEEREPVVMKKADLGGDNLVHKEVKGVENVFLGLDDIVEAGLISRQVGEKDGIIEDVGVGEDDLSQEGVNVDRAVEPKKENVPRIKEEVVGMVRYFTRRNRTPNPTPEKLNLKVVVSPVKKPEQPVFNLSAMEFPSFSLGFTQSPPEKKEINPVVVENPISNVKESPIGVKQSPIVVKESPVVQNQESPMKKGQKRNEQVVKRRQQPKRACTLRTTNRAVKKTKAVKNDDIEEVQSIPTTQEEDTDEMLQYIHEMGPMAVDFQTWIVSDTVKKSKVKLPQFVFKYVEEMKDWSFFTDSIFSDNGEIPAEGKIPLADITWEYPNRDLLSEEISNMLDEWVRKDKLKEFSVHDYPFYNEESNMFCTVDHFRDLLFSQNFIGAEVYNYFLSFDSSLYSYALVWIGSI